MASDENLRGSEPLNHLSRRQTPTLPGHGSAWNVTLGHIKREAEWMVPSDQGWKRSDSDAYLGVCSSLGGDHVQG